MSNHESEARSFLVIDFLVIDFLVIDFLVIDFLVIDFLVIGPWGQVDSLDRHAVAGGQDPHGRERSGHGAIVWGRMVC